ncbi:gamma-glutamylcyclotransferase [Pseudaestuariivita atlantica]|uniref:glutathione-specific gamma-glutamylcyclotransferase n=1 Tax=Pseudaestuariivita atlantica TaxID=1317121 RepID=A0A0L1JLW5_9RHOB|nr:gamma-glutamylcyclotransferase [Pseudaestuariivita atlantica]KNG92712.1 gamma-glutamyl cyclotransferase [Pseudaestuariivita atlantica]
MTLWVFGYGSLLWNPGFTVAEQRRARLRGYARSFCMRSIHHRGTPENPGLVLALDAQTGAACDGVALRVPEAEEDATLAYLRERELVSSAYLERWLSVETDAGEALTALTYVVDPDHVQYCGGLPLEEQARIMAAATGGRGPNAEYLHNTAALLADLHIEDADIAWLDARVRNLTD